MQLTDTAAICLKATPFQEAHQVVTLYSAQGGMISVMAKGVKKPNSKLAGACEPLTLNHVYLASGRSMYTLCHYERIESFAFLRSQLDRLAAASVCTDLVRILGREHDPDSQVVYHLLAQALGHFNEGDVPWVETSLRFQWELLRLAGYAPQLETCVVCDGSLECENACYYPFSIALGGFLCHLCVSSDPRRVNVSVQTLQLLRYPASRQWEGSIVKAHRFLAYYWQSRLEQPVSSFKFLLQLLEDDVKTSLS